MSISTDEVIMYNIITMESHETDSELSNMDLNVASLIVLPMKFIFCYNCLRNMIWFGKLSLSQRYRLLHM